MSAPVDYFQADSTNLPDIDVAVILEYYTSDRSNIAEIRAVKKLMASRSGYVRDVVGYVEFNRDGDDCIVRAKILPEPKRTKKYCLVSVSVNEKESTITDTSCDGCPSSEGICQHILLFLFWLEKKSMESPESVENYWKKPLGSKAAKPVLVKDLVKPSKRVTVGPPNPAVLKAFIKECKRRKIRNSLILSMAPEYD